MTLMEPFRKVQCIHDAVQAVKCRLRGLIPKKDIIGCNFICMFINVMLLSIIGVEVVSLLILSKDIVAAV